MKFTAGASFNDDQMIIEDWTGRSCVFCSGTGESKDDDYRRACQSCAGTGEEYAYVCAAPTSAVRR